MCFAGHFFDKHSYTRQPVKMDFVGECCLGSVKYFMKK